MSCEQLAGSGEQHLGAHGRRIYYYSIEYFDG